MLAGRMIANEHLAIARGRLLAGAIGAHDIEVIDKQSAALVGIDVLPRIRQIGKFGEGGAYVVYPGLHRNAARELSAIVAERGVAFDDVGDDNPTFGYDRGE